MVNLKEIFQKSFLSSGPTIKVAFYNNKAFVWVVKIPRLIVVSADDPELFVAPYIPKLTFYPIQDERVQAILHDRSYANALVAEDKFAGIVGDILAFDTIGNVLFQRVNYYGEKVNVIEKVKEYYKAEIVSVKKILS